MVAQQDPPTLPLSGLAAVQAHSDSDRELLALLFTAEGSLTDIAAACGTDLITLAECLLSPRIQAALDAIEQAAARFSHLRALIGRPVALATLAEVSTADNPNPVERRRAASAFLRASPNPPLPAQPPLPRGGPAGEDQCIAPAIDQVSGAAPASITADDPAPHPLTLQDPVPPPEIPLAAPTPRARDRPAPIPSLAA
jgi:hypothetical protein